MRLRLIALAVVAALLALAAPAAADDRSVWAAWSGHDAEGIKLQKRMDRSFKRWERSDFRRWKPAYEASRAVARFMKRVEDEIEAQSASTPKGQETRALALKSVRAFRLSYGQLARAVRLTVRRKPTAARRALRRAVRYEKSAVRYSRRAEQGFKELGFSR